MKVHSGLLILRSGLVLRYSLSNSSTILTKTLYPTNRNSIEWLSAFQAVHDSVCLHRGLLNWFQNRLEMVLLLYTSHNSTSHQSPAIIYLDDDVSIRLCQPLTAALWIVVLGGWALLTNTTTKGSHWLEWAKASIEARQFIRWLLIQNTQRQAYRHTQTHPISLNLLCAHPHSYTDKHTILQI